MCILHIRWGSVSIFYVYFISSRVPCVHYTSGGVPWVYFMSSRVPCVYYISGGVPWVYFMSSRVSWPNKPGKRPQKSSLNSSDNSKIYSSLLYSWNTHIRERTDPISLKLHTFWNTELCTLRNPIYCTGLYSPRRPATYFIASIRYKILT
jgi:hypothetical protein